MPAVVSSISTAKEISIEDLRARVAGASVKIPDPISYQTDLDVMDRIKFISETVRPDGSLSIRIDQAFLDRFYIGDNKVNLRAVRCLILNEGVLDRVPDCSLSLPLECHLTYNQSNPKLHNNASISACSFKIAAGSSDPTVTIALATTCGCDAADQFESDLRQAIERGGNQETRISSMKFGVNRGEFSIQLEPKHAKDRVLIASELVQNIVSDLSGACTGKPRVATKTDVDLSGVLSMTVNDLETGILEMKWTLGEEPNLRSRQKSAQTLRGFAEGFSEVLDLLATGQVITDGLRKLPHQLDDLSRQDLFAKSNRLWLDHGSLERKQAIKAVAALIEAWEVAVEASLK